MNNEYDSNENGNELHLISLRRKLAVAAVMILGGLAASAALPPLNCTALVYIAYLPLVFAAMRFRVRGAMLCGLLFGWPWTLTAFWFLREIQGSFYSIPFILATIIGAYYAIFAGLMSFMHRYLRWGRDWRLATATERAGKLPRWYGNMAFALVFAAAYLVVIEWGRAWALPWNYLAITHYKYPTFLQAGSLGSSYLISFFIIFFGAALGVDADSFLRRKKRAAIPWATLLAAALIGGNILFGAVRMSSFDPGETTEVSLGLIQPNLSQRRAAGRAETIEAIEVTFDLMSKVAADGGAQAIITPETTIPIPFSGAGSEGVQLRWALKQFVDKQNVPLLIGVPDFEYESADSHELNHFNRAWLILPNIWPPSESYDKSHRVPYGEYVPMRKYMPQWMIDVIDMGRDLTPGNSFSPLNLLPGVRTGVAICFEDVFPYISRREAQLGANMLLVITNDAWYPTSAEPEQHFANCILRAIETGLPMVRCGNNSASVVITPLGTLSDGLLRDDAGEVDPLSKERAFGVVKVEVAKTPLPTVFVRYGAWFIFSMLGVTLVGFLVACFRWYGDKQQLVQQLKKNRGEK